MAIRTVDGSGARDCVSVVTPLCPSGSLKDIIHGVRSFKLPSYSSTWLSSGLLPPDLLPSELPYSFYTAMRNSRLLNSHGQISQDFKFAISSLIRTFAILDPHFTFWSIWMQCTSPSSAYARVHLIRKMPEAWQTLFSLSVDHCLCWRRQLGDWSRLPSLIVSTVQTNHHVLRRLNAQNAFPAVENPLPVITVTMADCFSAWVAGYNLYHDNYIHDISLFGTVSYSSLNCIL